MNPRILIIDYNVGNFQSVANALNFLGYNFSVSGDPKDLKTADVFILPGVGAFHEAMKNLASRELIEPLREAVLGNQKPILGICLGMQVLAEDSEEFGFHKGLGFIPGHVVRFKDKAGFPLPHVGWNNISIIKKDPLLSRVSDNSNYYFDHSFYFQCDKKYTIAKCNYGIEFSAAVQRDNVFGTQFHPEKSQVAGLKLFRGFIEGVKSHSRV